MLTLKNIHKKYYTYETSVEALKGISVSFRKNEFVSILGPSGGGKTTLLNIIGGLDHYSEGDLIIDGKSTRRFLDKDWDNYRNHRVGFVFQSYNLIPHQNVLSNVELALTLSGISKSERKKRAVKALEDVGLGDQLKKKPSEMSGGQMQRVAIARALVNDPDIILADEPTGALDTQTSVQVIDLLKEIAKDRLVIMVTHNSELAEKYSTRIVSIRDGRITDDTHPFDETVQEETDAANQKKKKKNRSMSLLTALSLSLNNLMTKKGRTILTALAGSIGIIGIALILSLSTGINHYISDVQQDTLDSFPLTIDKQTFDTSAFMSGSAMGRNAQENTHDNDKVYSNAAMVERASAMSGSLKQNSMTAFKSYLDNPNSDIKSYVGNNGIIYSYDANFDVFAYDENGALVNTDGTTFLGNSAASQLFTSDLMDTEDFMEMMSAGNSYGALTQLVPKSDGTGISDAVTNQYDLIYGTWPESYDEVVLALDENNEIMSSHLYQLGLLPSEEYKEIMQKVRNGEEVKEKVSSFTYEEICNKELYVVPACDQYKRNANGYFDYLGKDEKAMKKLTQNGIKLRISGIIRVKDDTVSISTISAVGYTKDLADYVIEYSKDSEVVKAQQNNPELDILTGKKFADEQNTLISKLLGSMASMLPEKSYRANLDKLGMISEDSPTSIAIYADSFENKEKIMECIDEYNESVDKTDKITYTDYVGLVMSSVTKIIDAVSLVLIGFVAISLVVSSIMIGIITYISVLERKKEIGILRAIGASKRDISRVFNAETFIVGISAGLLGVGITALLLLPINALLHHLLTSLTVSAVLPVSGAVILVIISVVLTLISGLIPAGIAAKKDPVEALRSE